MSEKVTVTIGELGLTSLGGARKGDPESLSRAVAQALRYYLADRESGRPEWPYPGFMREHAQGASAEVAIAVPDSVWGEFTAEAERQRVSLDQLAQHAVLYLLADWDSGRLVERILESLDG